MNCHYEFKDLINGFKHIGIKEGDTLFCHSNIGFFGRLKDAETSEQTVKSILDAFFEVLGSTGTLVVPSYTYSFSKNLPYDPEHTPTDCGIFSESLRCHPNAKRSHDPNISVVAIGSKAEDLTQNVPTNAYSEDSFFDRFYHENGKIVNLNFDAGSTFIHYVERKLNVPYRFDKTFQGEFKYRDILESRSSTIFVRDNSNDNTISEFSIFDKLAREHGKFRTQKIGRGFIAMISSKDTFELIQKYLSIYPDFLTKKHLNTLAPSKDRMIS